MNKEGKSKEPSLFDQMNEYLKKEAPKDIEDPTVEGIAERMGIPEDKTKLLACQRPTIQGRTNTS